jgi:ComF family protein
MLPEARGAWKAWPEGRALTRRCGQWGTALLDLLIPPQCPGCATPTPRQGSFCAACFAQLTFITPPLCTGCGLPFASQAFAGPRGLCAPCEDQPRPWHEARAALLYDAAARRLILALKHADRQENAAVLAAHMARAGDSLLARAALLVPVPLHLRRLRQRGFNQSALLARALARRSGVPCMPDVLRRVRATPPLGTMTAAARRDALDGAVTLRERRRALVAGRRVLLIDDVMTSGATVACCARALLDGGASHVDVLVASRVPDPRQHP